MNTIEQKKSNVSSYLRFLYIIVVTSFILSLTNIIEMTFLSYEGGELVVLTTKQLAAGTFIFPVEIVRINYEGTIVSLSTNFCFNACLTYILFGSGLLIALVFSKKRFGIIINCIALILAGLCFIGSGFILIFFREAVIPQLTDKVLQLLFQCEYLSIKTLPIGYISGGIAIGSGIGFILAIIPLIKIHREVKNDNN